MLRSALGQRVLWLTAAVWLLVDPGPSRPLSMAAGLSESQQYELNLSKGLVQFANGDYVGAEALFRDALRLKPGDVDATAHLGQTLIRLRRYAEAEALLRQAVAQRPDGGTLLALGMTQYYQGKSQEAVERLEQAQRLIPDHPLVYFYRGLALNRLGRYREASDAFEHAMLLSPDLAPEGHYQRGLARYGLGMVDEAQAELKAVTTTQPESELARSARRFLEQIRSPIAPTGPKSWDLDFAVSGQYDSNVVLLPLGVQPPPSGGITRKDDYRAVFYGRGEYRPIQTGVWTVGLSYAFYRSFHRELHAFDVENHTPSLYVLRRFGAADLSVQYIYDYVNVGQAPFLISHAIHPVLTIRESDRLFTQAHVQYMNKDFQHGRFPTNSDRDARNWLVGATQYILYAERTGNIRLGYYFDTDRTGGEGRAVALTPSPADWSYTGHRLSSGLGLPPVWKTRLDLAFDYYRQNYDHPNSFSATGTTVRQDNIYIFTAALTRPLTPWLSASLEYSYTRDQSNVLVFDYSRSIYSILFAGHF